MLPPGSRLPAPLQTLLWILDPAGSIERAFRHHGDVFAVNSAVFGEEIFFVTPELAREVFTADPDLLRAGEANAPLGLVLGPRSVLVLDGEAHLETRRLMLPAFHGERIRRYTETMRDIAAREVDAWRPGDRIALQEVMQRITLDVILRTVLGLDDGPGQARLRAQITRVLELVQSPIGALFMHPGLQRDLGPLTPWRAIQRAIAEMDRLLLAHVAERRARPAAERGDDVLAMLLEARGEDGRGLSDAELRDQLVTLLVAGHETSATTLSWAFEEVLRCAGEQERLGAEIDAVVGAGPLAAEHLPRLERVDAVIKEAMRLHPVVPVVGRKLARPATIGGFTLPAGKTVIVPMHLIHRRPDLYPDPERFDPARFVGKKVDAYEWLPFGGGGRRCLGMAFAMHEMKIIVAEVAGRVRLGLAGRGPARTVLRSFMHAPLGKTRVIVEARRARPAAAGARASAA